jgi:hypothetical protein
MFGPTISLLPISPEPELDGAVAAPAADGDDVLDTLDTPGCVKLLLALKGEFGELESRLPKRVSERSMVSPEIKCAAPERHDTWHD